MLQQRDMIPRLFLRSIHHHRPVQRHDCSRLESLCHRQLRPQQRANAQAIPNEIQHLELIGSDANTWIWIFLNAAITVP